MPLLEEVSKKDTINLDLTWFHLSGQMNSRFTSRGVPMRFTCVDVTENVMSISRNGHPVALYLRDVQRLYRLNGSLTLQWCMVRNAFITIFGGIIVIE